MVKNSFRFMFDMLHFWLVDATSTEYGIGIPAIILVPIVGAIVIAAILTSPIWLPLVVVAHWCGYLESK